MRKLTWAARGVAAVSGAMLLGALAMPAAAAHGPDPKGQPAKGKPSKGQPVRETPVRPTTPRCSSERDVSSAVVDYSSSGLFETVFRAATDRQGHAFLNDSRNPGVWINLALLPGAPTCAQDTAVSVTEEDPGNLYITLLGSDGTLHQAQCATASGTPFTPATLPAACGAGFTPLPGTPV
ncbi:hypothetical protein ACGFX2_20185 [Streptomyces goshikiensis]|uniref:hypothetical protein n=1 Tax=Streptomyces goshikiensis TaxID=1942 RepID=UPI00371AE2D0